MKPLSVLVTTVPVPAHTWNAAPFVRELISRGHQVGWYAADRYRDVVASTGAEHLAFDRCSQAATIDTPPPVGRRRGWRDLAHVRRLYATAFAGATQARFDDLVAVQRRRHVDLVLTDTLSYGSGLSADTSGVPWVSFGDGPLVQWDVDTPPFGSGLTPRPGLPWRNRNRTVQAATDGLLFRAARRELNTARHHQGQPPHHGPLVTGNTSPILHLQCSTEGFEFPRRHNSKAVRWVGPVRHPRPNDWVEPAWWPEVTQTDRPVVLVSQGTMRPDSTELLLPAVRGLAEQPYNVLLTTGHGGAGRGGAAQLNAALRGDRPSTVRVENFVPYEPLLPHVDVFVTNGGYTSVVWALAHGIPIVQAGVTEEKCDVGARIAWAGVGLSLGTSRPRPAAVRSAVQRVLSEPRYRRAARALADEMAPLDAGHDGVDAIEELLQQRLR